MRAIVARMRNRGLILSMLACACTLLLLLPSLALADGGMIPIGDTFIYEPGQKAIIGWNGNQETLILSTDVYADSHTAVLRIIPLPSQPAIQQGNFDSFVRIGELLDEHFARRYHWWDCPGGMEEGTTGVEIVFHEKIGAHDIWVVKANDAGEFAEWAEDFLARNGIDYQIFPQEQRPEDLVTIGPGRYPSPLEWVVSGYILEGIDFFVFDLIELVPDLRSVEPIVYHFETDCLYYPLTISSVIPGETKISLFLLTPQPLDLEKLREIEPRVEEVGMRVAWTGGRPIQCKLNAAEVASIDLRLEELLGGDAWLTALVSSWGRYEGTIPLASLDEDVRLTEAFLTEPPESSAPMWGWTILGVVVIALISFIYFKRRRGAQLRRMEREYRKRAWERMQQR